MPEAKRDEVPLPEILPCPFCGHQPRRDNLDDSLHPVGRSSDLWTFSCVDNEGGCNASVLGRSAIDCIERWNRRLPVMPEEVMDGVRLLEALAKFPSRKDEGPPLRALLDWLRSQSLIKE